MPQRHMLIVGNGQEIPSRVHDLFPGLRTTLLVRAPKVRRVRDPKRHARIIGVATGWTEEWVAVARDIHARDPFDCLGSFTDVDQSEAAAIGAALGLRTHTVETVRYTRDKVAMRRRLVEAGVEQIASEGVDSVAGLHRFAAAHGYPVVVKPVAGAASSGVSIVRSPAELEQAWEWGKAAREPDSNELMIEEFLDGQELSVEAFSHDGEHFVVALTEKVKEPRHCLEIGHMVRASFPAETVAAVSAHVGRVLTALAVRDGITHTELILTSAGPRVVETHLRRGGDSIVEMISDTYGVDLVALLVRQTMGEDVRPALAAGLERLRSSQKYPAIWYEIPQAAGRIVAVDGIDEARRAPGVVDVDVAYGVGDELPREVGDSRARAVAVRAVAESPAQALRAARSAAQLVRLTVVAAPSFAGTAAGLID